MSEKDKICGAKHSVFSFPLPGEMTRQEIIFSLGFGSRISFYLITVTTSLPKKAYRKNHLEQK